MKIIAKGIGEGKTTDLIKMSAETGYHIVSFDRNSAYHTAELAKNMGLEILYPLTNTEFVLQQWNGQHPKGFLIDDAEFLFQRLLGSTSSAVHAMTITIETLVEKIWVTPDGSFDVRVYGTVSEHRTIINIEADIDKRNDGRWHWEVHHGLYSGFSKTEELAKKAAIRALSKHSKLMKGEENA